MAFLKKLKKKTRDLRSQAQRQAQPATSMGNKFERMFGISRQLPRPMPNPLGGIMGGVDFLPGYGEFPLVNLDPDLNPPTSVSPPMRMPSRRPRRLPQIMPERMPSRFTGGGLGSFFERIFDQLEREDESPRLPMPEDMPRERFPMIRPGFAGGEEVNMDMMMADQAARQGMSPAEQRMMMIQKTAADMGRTISDRDAQLFGMGEISFEEAMMEMIQSGASEEQIVAALKEMGLDEEDIQQVMMMVAEEMAGQESIDGQLAQMM
jgi:hypothetical protein